MNDKKLLLGIAIGIGGLLVLEAIVFLFITFSQPRAVITDPEITPTPTITATPIVTTAIPTITTSTTPTITVSTTVTPTVTTSKYKYSIPVESVTYEPDSLNYVGFRTCDLKNSTCTVYGIKASRIAKVVSGGTYMLSFNGTNACDAAAGTSYCEIPGDFQLK